MKRFLSGDSFCRSAKRFRLNWVWASVRAGSIAFGRGMARGAAGDAIGNALVVEGMTEQPTTPMVPRLMTSARVRQLKGFRFVMVDRRLPVL